MQIQCGYWRLQRLATQVSGLYTFHFQCEKFFLVAELRPLWSGRSPSHCDWSARGVFPLSNLFRRFRPELVEVVIKTTAAQTEQLKSRKPSDSTHTLS